jgi:hypothetical protein
MRFEFLVWTAMALFLMVSASASLGGDVSANRDFQAADGGSTTPPPTGP